MLAIMSVWILLVSFTASSKTISGLLEFDSKTEAVEVLTVLNHYQIRIPSESGQQVFSWKWCTSRPLFFFFWHVCPFVPDGSNPYTLKLCFSTSSHLWRTTHLLVADVWSQQRGRQLAESRRRGSAVDSLLRWKEMRRECNQDLESTGWNGNSQTTPASNNRSGSWQTSNCIKLLCLCIREKKGMWMTEDVLLTNIVSVWAFELPEYTRQWTTDWKRQALGLENGEKLCFAQMSGDKFNPMLLF